MAKIDKKKPFKVPNNKTAYFDVDDTLLMWNIPEGTPENELVGVSYVPEFIEYGLPNKHNIDLLKKMKRRGHSVVVWSAGGSDWAEAVVQALRLEKYVDAVMPKPDYYIDDLSDPSKILGKHGYFNLNGTRAASDHLSHRPDFLDETYEELKK